MGIGHSPSAGVDGPPWEVVSGLATQNQKLQVRVTHRHKGLCPVDPEPKGRCPQALMRGLSSTRTLFFSSSWLSIRARGLQPQGYLMAQGGCWGSSHHQVCRREEKGFASPLS